MKKTKYNIMELAGLFYCFAISFCASTGETIVKLARIILFASFIMYIIHKKKINMNITTYDKWIIMFFIFCGLSLTWSISPTNTTTTLSSLMYLVICHIILCYILKNNHQYIYDMLKINIIGALAHGANLYLKHGLTIYFTSRGGVGVENANTIGFVCCFAFIFCFILLIQKKAKYKFLYIIFAGISLLFAILSASRKILIYLLVFFIFYYILSSKKILQKAGKIIVSLAIVCLVFFLIMKNQFLYEILGSRIESAIAGMLGESTDGSTAFRLKLINLGMEWFKSKPFLGYGLNCFKYLLGTSYNTWAGDSGIYAHNNYVELLVNLGISGTIIYYSMYINIIYNYFKAKNKSKNLLTSLCMILCIAIAEYGQITYSIAFFQEIILIAFFLMYMSQKNKNEVIKYENNKQN